MSRKILVPFDIENPNKRVRDFLYPKPTENGFELIGIKSKKESKFGMVVLTDHINENNILNKIVDSKIKINSVEKLLDSLKEYIKELPKYKVGNIIELVEKQNQIEFKVKYQRMTSKRTNMKGI